MEEAFLRTARSIYQNIQNGSLDLNAAGSFARSASVCLRCDSFCLGSAAPCVSRPPRADTGVVTGKTAPSSAAAPRPLIMGLAAASSNIVAHVIGTWLPFIVFCVLIELKEAVIETINKSVSFSSNSLSCHGCLLWLLVQRL